MKIDKNFEFSKVKDLDAFIQNFYRRKSDEIISRLKTCFFSSCEKSETNQQEGRPLTEQEADLFFDLLKYVDFENNRIENKFPVQIIAKRHGWNSEGNTLTANEFVGRILFKIRAKSHFELGNIEEDGISCDSWLLESYNVKDSIGRISFGKELYPYLKTFCQLPEVRVKIRQEEC